MENCIRIQIINQIKYGMLMMLTQGAYAQNITIPQTKVIRMNRLSTAASFKFLSGTWSGKKEKLKIKFRMNGRQKINGTRPIMYK